MRMTQVNWDNFLAKLQIHREVALWGCKSPLSPLFPQISKSPAEFDREWMGTFPTPDSF